MKNRIKAPAAALLAVLALTGCDNLLDVDNPNNLVEASIEDVLAANAVANGALASVGDAIPATWQPYLVASDDLYWIGSRDAWLSLDNGFVDDPNNEFIDGPYPDMNEARWLADKAISILEGHGAGYEEELARAYLYSGMIYMVIGETQEDVVIASDKREAGAPVGPANMGTAVLDAAVTKLGSAIATSSDSDLDMKATALRARAAQSRLIFDDLNPAPAAGGTPTVVNSAAAGTDALAVIVAAGGVTADWLYNLTYSASTYANDMAGWVNDRKENQVDLSLVTVDAANDIDGINLQDPIDGVDDPALIKFLEQWKGSAGTPGNFDDKGGVYPDVTIASTRLMHLILAENALATGDTGAGGQFEVHINHVRDMDGLTNWDATDVTHPGAVAMLQHTRRVNTFLQGLRLGDMYRWGLRPDASAGTLSTAIWAPASASYNRPGEMITISAIEIRANCNLNGLGC